MTASTGQDHSDDSTDPSPPGDGAPGEGVARYGDGAAPREDEVSLLDILLVLARNKALIIQTVLVFALIGLTYAVLAPEEYTSSAKVVREAQDEGSGLPGGISSGALSRLGVSLGGTSGGLTPTAFPSVLQSRPVRLAVARDTFRFPDAKRPMTFVEYANRPPGVFSRILKYTIWLPWTAAEAAVRTSSGGSASTGSTDTAESDSLSRKEKRAAKAVRDFVTSTIAQETGLMTVSVTAEEPRLAANLADSFVEHLTTRVREIRTAKMRERLQFIQERFREAEEELETAESRLAQFLERNQNPTTATLQFQRGRLQRQVGFKEQLYSDLQSQLTQARLDLQRRQPVVTVVEKPVAPTSPSGPNRLLYFLVAVVLGGGLAVGFVLARTFLTNWAERTEEGRDKMQELRDSLVPDFLRNGGGETVHAEDPETGRVEGTR
jgi:uncharacterized protein involved in exopolysaccharide biosynthesis